MIELVIQEEIAGETPVVTIRRRVRVLSVDESKSDPHSSDYNDAPGSQDESLPSIGRSTEAYSSAQFARDLYRETALPKAYGEKERSVWVTAAGVPVRASVFCMSKKPSPEEIPGEGGREIETLSPDDVMRIALYAPDDSTYQMIAEEGYSERTRTILRIPDQVVKELRLEDQKEMVEALFSDSAGYIRFSGRLLEYTVTREELPHAVTIISSYLNGTAQALGHPSIRLTPDDTLSLVLGGLTGSGVANLLDDVPGTPGKMTLMDLFRRPDMSEVEGLQVPLEDEQRQLLYSTSDLVQALSSATVPALAVILKEGSESDDYERATQVIADGLQSYYHSPMSLLYRKQYNKHRKREEIEYQRELASQFGSDGYQLTDYVQFPEQLPKPDFPLEYDLPDVTALDACPRRIHYRYMAERTVKDPDTDQEITMPWFIKEEPYRYGPVVDELLTDAFERGYMIVPLEWKDNQAAGDLLSLWTTIGLTSKSTPLQPEISGTLMISQEVSEFGRKMFFDFDDNTAGFGEEESSGFSSVVAEIQAAYADMPEEALSLLREDRKEISWLEMAKVGHFYFFENYPRPFELMLAHLRSRTERTKE